MSTRRMGPFVINYAIVLRLLENNLIIFVLNIRWERESQMEM